MIDSNYIRNSWTTSTRSYSTDYLSYPYTHPYTISWWDCASSFNNRSEPDLEREMSAESDMSIEELFD